MENRDEELIAKLVDKDPKLKSLVDEHRKLDQSVEAFDKRPYLTTEESMEKKRLKKLKLAKKDQIQAILVSYRKESAANGA